MNKVGLVNVEGKILLIRGHRVMIDADLADLYHVKTKVLVQAVKRNLKRFPADFMFQLFREEKKEVVTICDHLGKLKYSHALPFVFTEQGVAMLSSVLNSERAVLVNVEIMRAFVKIRQMIESHKELNNKITKLEKRYDYQFKVVFDAIRELMEPPKTKKKQIGFISTDNQKEFS